MAEQKGLNIAAMISGSGTNLRAILDACKDGRINGRVVVVGADTFNATGLNRAESVNVPTFVTNYAGLRQEYLADSDSFGWCKPDDKIIEEVFSKVVSKDLDNPFVTRDRLVWRMIFEELMLKELRQHEFDLLVLAGFMRVFSPYFIDQINVDSQRPRIMNIHPALLPAFPGTDGYADTFNYGCKIGGCTVHFVDYGEDTGPIIGQCAVTIEPGEPLEVFKQRGLEEEWRLYPECIQLFAEDRLRVVQGQGNRRVVEILK